MFKISAKKTVLKSCIKEDVSSKGETKRYLVGLRKTRFVERHVLIPAKHSKLGAKSFNSLPEDCSKCTKMAITIHEFSKYFQGSMPPDPLEPFLFLNLLQINFAGKNCALEKMSKFGAFSLKKFLITPQA